MASEVTRYQLTGGVVWDGTGLVVTDELEVREPGDGEVLVAIEASGICHSDLNVLDGNHPLRPPVVLGHEGAGRIAALGRGVDGWSIGDRVAICTLTPCGECPACADDRFTDCATAFGIGATPFRWRGTPARQYANCSSFASTTVVRASQLVAIGEIPAPQAALLGCAVSTGYGVAVNVARIRPGHRVAVVGIGGIGVNVLQSARALGAARIVAIDIDPQRAAIAERYGATDFVVTERGDDARAIVERVVAETGTTFDAVIECSGTPAAITAGLELLDRGGVLAPVGIPPRGSTVPIDIGALLAGKRIVGSYNGALRPAHDLPELMRLVDRGLIDLASQVSGTWPLAAIDDAIDALRGGRVVRAVVVHPTVG